MENIISIESANQALNQFTYFARIVGRYGKERSSAAEANRFIKEKGLELASFIGKNLDSFSAEKKSMAFYIDQAVQRKIQKEKISGSEKAFAGIIEKVILACESQFAGSWQKEIDRLRIQWNEFSQWSNVDQFHGSITRQSDSIRLFFEAKHGISNIHNASRSTWNQFNEFASDMRDFSRKGFEAAMEERRQDYIDFLTANLKKAIAKHLPENCTSIGNVMIDRSPKGYEIAFEIKENENRLGFFETRCIPVEGYQVRFHWRYITVISK